MRHSILRLAAALGLAGVFAAAVLSDVNARYYRYGYGHYGRGISYEGPNRERMVRSTGN